MNREEILSMDKTNLLPKSPTMVDDEKYRGYELSLMVAGVTVVDYQEFGAYQGEWWAYIELSDGVRYFVTDYYGSCTGCDDFEAHFYGYNLEEDKDFNYWEELRKFGAEYIQCCLNKDQAINKAKESYDYDLTSEEIIEWINSVSEKNENLGVRRKNFWL